MRKQSAIAGVLGVGLIFATPAFADPYNPAERAVGGGVGAVMGAATTPLRPHIAPPPITPTELRVRNNRVNTKEQNAHRVGNRRVAWGARLDTRNTVLF
jgi:hypothetical protein